MKTVTIKSSDNPVEGLQVQPYANKDLARNLVKFIPHGDDFSSIVGSRIFTIGHFRNNSKINFFVMFSVSIAEIDSMNRKGKLYSSAIICNSKAELKKSFLSALYKEEMQDIFPCLDSEYLVLRSFAHLQDTFKSPRYTNKLRQKVAQKIKKNKGLSLQSKDSLNQIYQRAERLIFSIFFNHDWNNLSKHVVFSTYNGFPDDDMFGLTIVRGERDNLDFCIPSLRPSSLPSLLNWIRRNYFSLTLFYLRF